MLLDKSKNTGYLNMSSVFLEIFASKLWKNPLLWSYLSRFYMQSGKMDDAGSSFVIWLGSYVEDLSCYEGLITGFWLYRYLVALFSFFLRKKDDDYGFVHISLPLIIDCWATIYWGKFCEDSLENMREYKEFRKLNTILCNMGAVLEMQKKGV